MTSPTPMPGTALPWEWDDRRFRLFRDDFKHDRIYSSSTVLAITDDAFRANAKDAAYIVWACNNAPALLRALEGLEAANEALCAKRSREVYLAIEAEAREELHDLDAARASARAAIASAKP